MQLQEYLAESEVEVYETYLEVKHFKEDYKIYEKNNKLIKTIGYQIMINDISNVTFIEEGETISIKFINHDKEYEYGIYKKEWWRY